MSESALTLTGPRKVAALLMALGTETAAKLLARLPPDMIDRVAVELLRTPELEVAVLDEVVGEAYAGLSAEYGVLAGGESFALNMLSEAFGESRARELLDRVLQSQVPIPFEFLRSGDAIQLKELLSAEHPQTIALVLAHLDARTAAHVLVELEPTLQIEVARRIALTEQVSPGVLVAIEDGLRRRVSTTVREVKPAGGVRPLAHVLNQVDRSTERQILGGLAEKDPALADEVRRLMFVFEDIAGLDERAMQRIIRELDSKDMALALRNVSETVKEKFLSNMSQRAAEMLRDEMSLTARVRLKNVEEAQQRIVDVIKRLEEQDEIVVSRGDADDVLV